MIYLASPYTSLDFSLRFERFKAAREFTAHHIGKGVALFSPIVYCHPLAEKYCLPGNFEHWRQFNFDILDRAKELWVLRLEGWQESYGVSSEIDRAVSVLNIPVSYHDPL